MVFNAETGFGAIFFETVFPGCARTIAQSIVAVRTDNNFFMVLFSAAKIKVGQGIQYIHSLISLRFMIRSSLSLYRNAYSGISSSVWWLALVMLVNRSGTMVIPFMTVYLTHHLNYSIAEAGFIMALYGGGSILGAYLGGRISDRIGFYP